MMTASVSIFCRFCSKFFFCGGGVYFLQDHGAGGARLYCAWVELRRVTLIGAIVGFRDGDEQCHMAGAWFVSLEFTIPLNVLQRFAKF